MQGVLLAHAGDVVGGLRRGFAYAHSSSQQQRVGGALFQELLLERSGDPSLVVWIGGLWISDQWEPP